MKVLKDILYKAGLQEILGTTSVEVNSVKFSSREVEKGCLFVAVRGTVTDGHEFIQQAVDAGAAAIVCESFPKMIRQGVTYVRVSDSAVALSVICGNFFDNPSAKLKLIGITGTNGKTTTATLLFHLFRRLGYRCGLISTVQNQVNEEVLPATHTTPDPVKLNGLLYMMVRENCDYCFMEVSSHAVAQHRIAGLTFRGGIFTNITHDHLDYHKTFDEYIRAKKGFFDMLGEDAFALYNADDKNGKIMVQNCKAQKHSFALKSMADFRTRVIENSFGGLLLNIDNNEVLCRLIGSFNAYNITGIYGAAILLGEEKLNVLTGISSLTPVEGRFEYIVSESKVIGIVDYAHTPDALQNVLSTIGDIRTRNEKVITVVGCGGDRDAAKRPLMAKIACEMSDKVILTSDNPRSEEPEKIIEEMKTGVQPQHYKKVLSVTDRREALRVACSLAAPGDIILVAGKGHEKYQDIKGVKHPFDDKQVLEDSFKIIES
ncbi:MAG: UDP-N-acetylmuramoyl-L-alanyl-D-glutamate--LD-lysine ligase [Bacteroidetes bacterium ADurb.Bin397]|jgi:UDP-N-acetylmuramoyl-L-alanyl-D-glutamate--2,6-diaminopimelate ligase|nr:UDP-N-acetylmuramoyl-L-alanyl-D-glutamate--2,6-diaminopimelate ligase [Bacteroidia bacterium]OQA12176.1 MAG: UDP-N-acetylmuramoyl-L-alanyl-D-glutamate--LD-lysine ligase [Bacteroidetes bacterium ADurb.Bin397]